MRKKWKDRKLEIKRSMGLKICIISSSFFCIAFVLTVAIISVLDYKAVSRKEEERFHTYIVDSLMAVDNKLKDMERVSLMSTTGEDVQEILKTYQKKKITLKNADEEYLTNYYTSLVTLRSDISGIYLFDNASMIYSYDTANPSRIRDVDAYEALNLVKEQGEGMLTANCLIASAQLPQFMRYSDRYNKDAFYKNSLWMIRDIYGFSPYKKIGSIALMTPSLTFHGMLTETIGTDMFYILCTEEGKIICCQEPDLIGRRVTEVSETMEKAMTSSVSDVVWQGEKCRVSQMQSSYSGLKLIVGKSKKAFVREVTEFLDYSILLGICAMGFVILLTFYSVKKILKPLEELSEGMSHFDENSLHVRYDVKSEDEAGMLVHSFNQMVDMLEGLIENKYVNEMKIKESELTEQKLSMLYLKSQVNPHFLYNTLDTIRIQAQINEDKAVADLLMKLVDFFRLSVKVDRQMVTLEHELKLLSAYLELMCYRYPQLTFGYDVEQELNDAQVPNFILQPVVENSLLHGLRNKGYRGGVNIAAHRLEASPEYMEIKIVDTGVGFNEAVKKRIEESLNDQNPEMLNAENKNSIGISNVQRRIKMLCGEECGLSYTENETAGVTAHILLRIVKEDN